MDMIYIDTDILSSFMYFEQYNIRLFYFNKNLIDMPILLNLFFVLQWGKKCMLFSNHHMSCNLAFHIQQQMKYDSFIK